MYSSGKFRIGPLAAALWITVTLQLISCNGEVEEAPRNLARVDAESGLRMRAGPDLDQPRLLLIPDGSEVEVLSFTGAEQVISGRAGKWTEVRFNQQTGWVFGGFLIFNNESQNLSLSDSEENSDFDASAPADECVSLDAHWRESGIVSEESEELVAREGAQATEYTYTKNTRQYGNGAILIENLYIESAETTYLFPAGIDFQNAFLTADRCELFEQFLVEAAPTSWPPENAAGTGSVDGLERQWTIEIVKNSQGEIEEVLYDEQGPGYGNVRIGYDPAGRVMIEADAGI